MLFWGATMPKHIQLKDSVGNVYPKTIYKTVSNIHIHAGESITDTDIKKANAVFIYYMTDTVTYTRSMIIPKGYADWFVSTEGSHILYVMINWTDGALIVSQYSTVHDNNKVVGYSLIV